MMTFSLRNMLLALGLLTRRLVADARGNTLAMTAAAVIPLAGLVGAGLDMSRAYMAQTRLQMACDAGALAGRRVMSGGVFNDTVKNEALKFFRFNFPTGEGGTTPQFGVDAFTPSVTGGDAAVQITASTKIKTTLMGMFGFTKIPISVSCGSKQDFVNTDIVLVLDTTGSMICAPTETSCTNTTEKSTSKIKSLRAAVLALYDELAPVQTQLESVGLRLRYGVVPYSSSVNVGKLLRAVNTSYVVSDDWTYQSRRGIFYGPALTTTTCYQLYGNSTACFSTAAAASSAAGTGISSSRCNNYGANTSFSGFSPSPSGTPTITGSTPGTITQVDYTFQAYNSGNSKCVRKVVTTTRDSNYTGGTGYTFQQWEYVPVTHNVATYVTGAATTIPTRTDGSTTTWKGCIEERGTTNTLTSTTSTIPADAKDLDIALVPTSDKTTKWKPFWPEVSYLPSNIYSWGGEAYKPQWACPAEARRMQSWTKSNLSTYLDTLTPDGGTYHDNGIIWGAHIISPDGAFATDNPSTYNSMPVSRYMIFMTDGLLDTGYQTLYTTYGIERWDARVTPGGTSSTETEQEARHRQRFRLMCTQVKSMGVSVWVVAFASALDTDLTNCASNSGQASTSANAADLTAKFVEIGKNIGALRLTK